jgi:alpha-ketoglutarate-dependent 2,4-dichlorophenoxyacetate dioxygenase
VETPHVSISFSPQHLSFFAESSPIDLRAVHDESELAEIRLGLDRFGVVLFRNQPFSDAEQLAFAQRLDGELHSKTGVSVLAKSRLGNEALTDISNVDENGEIMDSSDRRRMYSLGNRLWHTDASFQDPAGRYSLLHARVVPPVPADTGFADMRAAYDDLDDDTKDLIADLQVHHSIAYSRQTLGFAFSDEELTRLQGAVHPLVRVNPRTGRRSLYVASHAESIVGWPVPEGRLLLRDLIEHGIQSQYTYVHHWAVGDLVIWDNLASMHKGLRYDDRKYRRELRRVTTLDLPLSAAAQDAMDRLQLAAV